MSEPQESFQTEKLSPEQISRLWQHGMHEDQIFNDRLNFFLVVESVLLAVVAMLLNNLSAQSVSHPNQVLILRFIALLGLMLTFVWAYVQARQKYVFDALRSRMRKYIPEYAEIIQERAQRRWPFSNLTLLTYVVPALFVLIWIALQFVIN